MTNTIKETTLLTDGNYEYVIEVTNDESPSETEIMFMQLPEGQTQTQIDTLVNRHLKEREDLQKKETKEQEVINKALEELYAPTE
tara:strand:+ start:3185 stop:3439 length:255 start_codon:yes stop_codon:yes gene_type:complete